MLKHNLTALLTFNCYYLDCLAAITFSVTTLSTHEYLNDYGFPFILDLNDNNLFSVSGTSFSFPLFISISSP